MTKIRPVDVTKMVKSLEASRVQRQAQMLAGDITEADQNIRNCIATVTEALKNGVSVVTIRLGTTTAVYGDEIQDNLWNFHNSPAGYEKHLVNKFEEKYPNLFQGLSHLGAISISLDRLRRIQDPWTDSWAVDIKVEKAT